MARKRAAAAARRLRRNPKFPGRLLPRVVASTLMEPHKTPMDWLRRAAELRERASDCNDPWLVSEMLRAARLCDEHASETGERHGEE
jgi:hypothetical protein